MIPAEFTPGLLVRNKIYRHRAFVPVDGPVFAHEYSALTGSRVWGVYLVNGDNTYLWRLTDIYPVYEAKL